MSAPALRTAAGLLTILMLATGCAGGTPGGPPSADPTVSVATAPPVPAAPKVGGCHQLDVEAATAPVDSRAAVPCTQPHTSVTVKVGQLSPVLDGHLLAVDSATVRAQIARACPSSLAAYAGGDRTTQRLSRLEVVWFGPSLEEADAGANWYRCDVVALRSAGKLLELPRGMRGALAKKGALDRFGTCGTAAPGKPAFARVACAEKHSWRAIDVVEIDPKARYLGKGPAAAGDAACKDVASGRAANSLTFSWSFEWPTKEQWAEGQRYGYCWVPEG